MRRLNTSSDYEKTPSSFILEFILNLHTIYFFI